MSESQADPSANTEQFRAFMQSNEPEPAKKAPVALIVGLIAALLVVAVAIWLFTR